MNAPEILSHFEQVRRCGDGWIARCPAHEDRKPSLSIRDEGGKILLHCHAGCLIERVLEAAGLKMADLFSDSRGPQIAATYDYCDEQGAVLYQVVRYEPKAFKQRRPDGNGGWVPNVKGVRRVLYRLPDVLKAEFVLVVEGEKDADTGNALGLTATSSGAAGHWREEYSDYLRGKRVVIVADADEPGRKHAQNVAVSLSGKVESLKVLELQGAKDLSEWVERGGTRDALLEFISRASDWMPGTPEHGKKIVLVAADEFLKRTSRDEREWLAEGLLPASSQTIWQGRPKVGKSHSLLQLGFDLSSGLPVFGEFAVKRPVRCAYVEKSSENLKDPETAERINDALDVILEETHSAIALANHDRKQEAETVEAQGFGSTFVSARADGSFDLGRASGEIRRVRCEARFDAPAEFFLQKASIGDGEMIRWSEAPPDSKREKREEALRRVREGESKRQAAEAVGVSHTTVRNWLKDEEGGS